MKKPCTPPDPEGARKEILQRLKNATAGREAKQPEKPGFSFVQALKESPAQSFKKNLEEVNGICRIFPETDSLSACLQELAVSNGWKKIFCPELKIRTLLQDAGLTDVITDTFDYDIEVSVTGCEALVADLGSVMVSSAMSLSRQAFCYAPVHVVIADFTKIVTTTDEALQQILNQYDQTLPSFISVITGPSRTADIEKTLILGAHGPKSLYVFISERKLC